MAHLASSAPNALYGPEDLMDMTLAMCSQNQFVATCVRAMARHRTRTMTGQRFLQLLGAQPPDEMLEASLNILESTAAILRESGRLGGPVRVGVDEVLLERYDGKKPEHKGGRRKNGTNRFEGYITMQIVSHRDPVTIGGYPIANGESQTHYLGGLIENALRLGVDMEVVLLDRGFNSVDNILEMESLGVHHIMPLRGSGRLSDIIEDVDAGGDPIRAYTMVNKDGRQSTSTLVVCPKRNPPKSARAADRYVAFITNIRVDNPRDLLRHIPKTYRKRWGIETGYRVLKQARARTKSPRMAARLFLMFFSLAYVNFWLLYRRALIGNGGPHAELPMADYSDILWMSVTASGRPP
ncbi:MAG: transposase [Thaumarchaeota archaeon]|nr:transposase [Nitrososphaerota archaeon]